jgi:hypothetical protein
MNDVWQICEKKGNQSGCAAEQRGLHQTKRKEKKRKTTQSKLTQTFSPHELTFAFLATAKADRSTGATTQGRAQMSIWISVECACLPACTRAAITQKRAPKGSSSSSSSSKPNLQTGYESARQRIVNVLTCASSHCNHKLNKPVFGRLLPSSFF